VLLGIGGGDLRGEQVVPNAPALRDKILHILGLGRQSDDVAFCQAMLQFARSTSTWAQAISSFRSKAVVASSARNVFNWARLLATVFRIRSPVYIGTIAATAELANCYCPPLATLGCLLLLGTEMGLERNA
jgi:hypothetical protein